METTDTSRINREVYVRICGRLVVKFRRPTRPLEVALQEEASNHLKLRR